MFSDMLDDPVGRVVLCFFLVVGLLIYNVHQQDKKKVACSLKYETHTVEFNRCVHLGE